MLKSFPNVMSISRIFLMFPLISFLNLVNQSPKYQIYSFFIILLVFLTDVLDGYLARKLKAVTSIGKILDPVSDKICLMIILIYLINKVGFIFFIFFILLSIRDIVLISLSCYLAIEYSFISQANKMGKNFMFSSFIMIISFLFNFNYYISLSFYIISILMLFISTVMYTIEHLKNIKKYENI